MVEVVEVMEVEEDEYKIGMEEKVMMEDDGGGNRDKEGGGGGWKKGRGVRRKRR